MDESHNTFNSRTSPVRTHRRPAMARRQHLTLTVLLAVVVFLSITYFFSSSASPIRRAAAPFGRDAESISQKTTAAPPSEPNSDFTVDLDAIPTLSEGDSIAPKLENATLKYVDFVASLLPTSRRPNLVAHRLLPCYVGRPTQKKEIGGSSR